MRCPVQPLRSLMTFASWMFIWVSTFCMRWMQVLTRVHMVAALAPVRPHDANLGGRVKRVAEQAVGVELQQPLALLHVALAPGEILGVPRVHQIDLKAPSVEDLVQRNPVDAGRLHRDGGHAALLQPVRQTDARSAVKHSNRRTESGSRSGRTAT